jgi:hypothetical protein
MPVAIMQSLATEVKNSLQSPARTKLAAEPRSYNESPKAHDGLVNGGLLFISEAWKFVMSGPFWHSCAETENRETLLQVITWLRFTSKAAQTSAKKIYYAAKTTRNGRTFAHRKTPLPWTTAIPIRVL